MISWFNSVACFKPSKKNGPEEYIHKKKLNKHHISDLWPFKHFSWSHRTMFSHVQHYCMTRTNGKICTIRCKIKEDFGNSPKVDGKNSDKKNLLIQRIFSSFRREEKCLQHFSLNFSENSHSDLRDLSEICENILTWNFQSKIEILYSIRII